MDWTSAFFMAALVAVIAAAARYGFSKARLDTSLTALIALAVSTVLAVGGLSAGIVLRTMSEISFVAEQQASRKVDLDLREEQIREGESCMPAVRLDVVKAVKVKSNDSAYIRFASLPDQDRIVASTLLGDLQRGDVVVIHDDGARIRTIQRVLMPIEAKARLGR